MTTKVQQKPERTKREQLLRKLVGAAIDCVAEHCIEKFDCEEDEETITCEIDFHHNGEMIGYIEYEAYCRCTYKANRYNSYDDPPDYDDYDFFYEEINVCIVNQIGEEHRNLSEAVNDRLWKEKYKQLN